MGGRDAARDPARLAAQMRGISAEEIGALCSGEGYRAGAARRRRDGAARDGDARGRAGSMCAAIIPNGWRPPSRGAFGERGRGGQGARRPRAARSARQHAEGDAREGAERARPSRCRADAAVADRPAHPAAAPTAAARRSRPSRPISRALSKSRTRARSSPRCSARRQPGEQVLDLCAGGGGKTLALAAEMDNRGQIYATDRRWRAGLRRSMRGWSAPAPAMSRCARRAAAPTCSPISQATAISCWSMRLAPAPAPGGAIPMPNGACARRAGAAHQGTGRSS